ncbi:MAG: alpha-amylase family glycosyl hydrolase [Nitrospirota bacterium]
MADKAPTAVTRPLPQGAVDHGGGTVTFVLYAPGKSSVRLVGSFNGWDREADPMEEAEEGLWWTEKQLSSGTYQYRYLVDSGLAICDPYARAAGRDPESGEPCSVLIAGQRPYRWQHATWDRPAFKDLIIYELNIRDFSPEGNFKGVVERFDYLEDLGITAIELMPVLTAEGGEGWGYDPTDFFAVNSAFGTADELRSLIDTAHSRGIGVVLDIVLAHTSRGHPFAKLYPLEESPWYGPGLGEPNHFGFPSLDYTKRATQEFARDVITYWLQEFRFDGLRFDYLYGIGAKDGCGIPFLARCGREADPEAWLIAEHSPERPRLIVESGFDGSWHVIARYALVALLRQGQLDEHNWNEFEKVTSYFDPRSTGYDTVWRAVNFLESHDEERIIHDTRVVGLTEEEAYRKAALGATVIMTLPGEPMLLNGQEWGEDTQKTLERNPLHWDKLETDAGRQLYEHVRALCRLRKESPALRSANYSVAARYSGQKTLVYRRWDDRGNDALVAVNFSPREQPVFIPFPRPGTWREALTGTGITTTGDVTTSLAPSSARVFIWERQGA